MDSRWKPDSLVLGPGGIKGFLEIGALMTLSKHGYLDNIKTIVGVSVGAIIGLLYTAGYSFDEIIDEASGYDMFQDVFAIDIFKVKENVGLISNKSIKERLESRMKAKFAKVPTLYELYLATGINFICVASDITNHRPEYFGKNDIHGELSCVDAVLMSINIPLLFFKIKYQGNIYIDGACADLYPINTIDDGKRHVLGIYIDSINIDPDKSLISYIDATIHSQIIQNIKRSIEKSSSRCKHLCLKSDIIDTTGMTIDSVKKGQMVLHGMSEGSKFIKSLDLSDA